MQIGLIARHDVREVEAWAKTQGMTLIRTVNRMVRVETDLATIEKALHVTWESITQGWHTASEPTLPACIQHVSGLSTQGHLHHMHVYPPGSHSVANVEGFPPIVYNNGLSSPGYTPANILAAYEADVPWDGAGETIGICEWGQDFAQSDLDLFCSLLGLPAITPTVVNVGGYVPSGGIGTEANLDVQWAHGMAPGAAITVYQGAPGTPVNPNSATQAFAAWGLEVTEMLNFIAAQPDPPHILSISYGNMESSFTPGDLQAWELAMQDLGNKGCTVVVSSGDQGAFGDHAPHYPQVAQACAPASCPHALSVGGTTLFANNVTYGPEWAWTNWFGMGASGGGFSQEFTEPSYQFGTVGKRQVPDLAACADPLAPAFFVINGQSAIVGGTSWAAPVVAGLLTRINHARRLAGFHPLGFINPVLYDLQRRHIPICKDITLGNNTFDSVTGYQAQAGYDWVTGWGSPILTAWLDQLAWGAPKP